MLTREQRLSIQVDTSVATRTFRHHVVEGLVRTRDLSDGMQLPTLAGSEITVQIQQQVCYNMSLHEMEELQKYFNHLTVKLSQISSQSAIVSSRSSVLLTNEKFRDKK